MMVVIHHSSVEFRPKQFIQVNTYPTILTLKLRWMIIGVNVHDHGHQTATIEVDGIVRQVSNESMVPTIMLLGRYRTMPGS